MAEQDFSGFLKKVRAREKELQAEGRFVAQQKAFQEKQLEGLKKRKESSASVRQLERDIGTTQAVQEAQAQEQVILTVDNKSIGATPEFAQKAQRAIEERNIAQRLAQEGVSSKSTAPLRSEVRRELAVLEDKRNINTARPATFSETKAQEFLTIKKSGVLKNDTRTDRKDNFDTIATFGAKPTGKTYREMAEGTIFTPKFFKDKENIARAFNAGVVDPVKSFGRGALETAKVTNPVTPLINKFSNQKTPSLVETLKNPDVQFFVIGSATIGAGFLASASKKVIVQQTAKFVEASSFLTFAGLGIKNVSKDPSPENIGIAIASSIPILTKGKTIVQDVRVRFNAKFVPPEQIFSAKALSGKEPFPLVSSVDDSLKFFRDADGFVVTASPAPISGKSAGIGKKAGLGLEDPGIFVTPLEKGNPFFTRITSVDDSFSFSLNPFDGQPSKPTATVFKTQGVVLLPKEVTAVPGFEAVKKFQQETLAGTGVVAITKRSQLGQGNIKSQQFVTPSGKKVFEPGTTELEAVIPFEQSFTLYPEKRFFTTFRGRTVKVSLGQLDVNKKLVIDPLNINKQRVSISKGASDLSSLNKPVVSVSKPFIAGSSLLTTSSSSSSSGGSSFSGSSSGVSTPSSSSSFISGGSSKASSSGSSSGVSTPSGSSSFSGGSSFISGGSSSSGGSSRASSIVPPPPIVPPPSFKKKKRKDEEEYDLVIGKKGNKLFQVIKGLTLDTALKRGEQIVGNTISASFQLQKEGFALSRAEKEKLLPKLNPTFGISKRGDRFVEQRNKRLSTRSETSQIKVFQNNRLTGSKNKTEKTLSLIKQGNSLRSIRKKVNKGFRL